MTRYRIVPERSRVWIEARSSLHPIHSRSDGLEGWFDLDVRGTGRVNLAAAPSGHLELPVQKLRSGNPLEDRELKRRIDASRFPTITGDLTTMVRTGADGRYLVEGELTFMGVKRMYRDEMTIERVDDGTVRLGGQSTFDVRDHGLEPPRILMLRVEPMVRVRVEIVAEPAD